MTDLLEIGLQLREIVLTLNLPKEKWTDIEIKFRVKPSASDGATVLLDNVSIKKAQE